MIKLTRRIYISLLVTLALIALMNILAFIKVGKQSEALASIIENNKKVMDKIEVDRQATERINALLEQKQAEIQALISNGDVATLQQRLDAISAELTSIKSEFYAYKSQHAAGKISQSEMEKKLVETENKIQELDAKYTVMQTALNSLSGSIDDKIREQLGDIDKLKEEIKQQILQELNQQNE